MGLQGPEYLAWLGEQRERDYTILMGSNTYRLMSGFAAKASYSKRTRLPPWMSWRQNVQGGVLVDVAASVGVG